MRAPLRREKHLSYVAIGRIAELQEVSVGDRDVSIGACTTHAELARRFAGISDCQALALAAGNAANPAIRQVATIGGNLCAANFPAADLVPALLCLNAEIELQGPQGGIDRIPLSRLLQIRASLSPGQLVRRVIIARAAPIGACPAAATQSRRLSRRYFQSRGNAEHSRNGHKRRRRRRICRADGAALARVGSRTHRSPA
jgi:CO/xanthine dehydrogenase FAD-binding subunit